jgi:hypothetical protein
MIIVGYLIFLLANNKAPYQLVVFIPPAAFFISHYFLLIRKRLKTELLFLVFFFSLILVNWGSYYNLKIPGFLIDNEKMLVQPSPLNEIVTGKRILVLGDAVNLYQDAQLATPYLDWKLAKAHFHALDFYDNITAIYRNIMDDAPEIIIDQERVMPELTSKIPALGVMYVRANIAGVYYKK